MPKERQVQSDILNTLARGEVRLFRQNVGMAWQGDRVVVAPGGRSAVIINPRAIHVGLVKGSGDLVGWRSVEITPDMVGQRVAVFANVEVKGPHGTGTKEQRNFVGAVLDAGGLAGFARSVDEARRILGVDTD